MRRLAARSIVVVLLVLLPAAAAEAAATPFTARGSVEQVYVTGLEPGARVVLLNRRGRTVKRKRANELGGLLFRNVRRGRGYRVRLAAGGPASAPLRVLSTRPEPPTTSIYEQEIPSDGYGYLTTRDGTKLAYSVHPPPDVSNAGGADPPRSPGSDVPTPTLIEYSGYGYARPSGPQSGIAALANVMGFTVVDVNMRGTGCSGGAFDFFEPLQNLDGYDIIETVARQPWVKHGKVGMLGISYGGISQLFTAQTQPPSLAAITPLSVIDQTQTTLYPGGILNTGFAVNWAKERQHEARPAGPDAGQPWAYERIQQGDETCKENQVLHPEAADLMKKVRRNDHYRPKVADPLSPLTFVNKIRVPVFMACQWQDEQTGGHCPTLAAQMNGTASKWFTFTNGTHVDSLSPEVFNRLYDFLKIYVAKEAPATGAAALHAAAPVAFAAIFGIEGMYLPPDPIQMQPSYEAARAAFEAQPPVRILFDNGAGSDNPGWPYPGFEQFFARFPLPGTAARSWYLGRGGALGERPARRRRADAFTWDARARPLTNFSGDTGAGEDGLWTATPPYKWQHPPGRTGLSYTTEPLDENVVSVGAGRVNLWVRASVRDVDLQVTLTEVRPDGKETFVQNGWVRTRVRKLDPLKSSFLEPVLSLRKRHRRPLPRRRFAKVAVPLYYHGHAFRTGSRIRVHVTAPNGDQPVWSFGETRPKGRARVRIAHGRRAPSRLVLPVVRGVDVPTGLPPCPGLRAQPCRDAAG
ncbi:MAG TPA: CocE/NonD family hydrolase [Solirubrobacteraceae bacterium]|nr:CocE/NonD family hydrolase [Solirubrobacteraceae bacterium]